MRNLIRKNLGGKQVFFLFVITNLVYAVMLTITIPKVMNFAGGMKLMDLMPTGYNPQYVNSLCSALGEKGRDAYLYFQLPVDMVYPLLFGVSSCLVLGYFLNKLGKLDGFLFYLCYIPLFSGLFDYCENIGIVNILREYPSNPDLLTHITSLFSVLKSGCTTLYFCLLIFSLILLGLKKFTKTPV